MGHVHADTLRGAAGGGPRAIVAGRCQWQYATETAVRASILLMLADHVRPSHVRTRLALSRNHVHYWVRRYVADGVGGVLHDAPRPGRRKRITPEQGATLRTRPPAATHWSLSTMAQT